MSRVVALDLGTVRIGVAVSDPGGVLASPYSEITRSGDDERDRRAILEVVQEVEADQVVVGVPYSLDGTVGPAAWAALDEAAKLGAMLGVPVATHDERFTTVSAHRALQEQGLNAKARRRRVDRAAAAVLLQAWLDSRAGSGEAGQR